MIHAASLCKNAASSLKTISGAARNGTGNVVYQNPLPKFATALLTFVSSTPTKSSAKCHSTAPKVARRFRPNEKFCEKASKSDTKNWRKYGSSLASA